MHFEKNIAPMVLCQPFQVFVSHHLMLLPRYQVIYASSPEDWGRLHMSPEEMAAVVTSEYLDQKGGRVDSDDITRW